MEMAGAEPGHAPKSYSLNMSKDVVPMCIFSETGQGECSVWYICLLKERTPLFLFLLCGLKLMLLHSICFASVS